MGNVTSRVPNKAGRRGRSRASKNNNSKVKALAVTPSQAIANASKSGALVPNAHKGANAPNKAKPAPPVPQTKHARYPSGGGYAGNYVSRVRDEPGIANGKVEEFKRPFGDVYGAYKIGKIDPNEGWPSIEVTPIANAKMLALVKECNIEIGWICSISRKGGNKFVIEDVFCLDQECTAATTEISEDGDANLMNELLENGDFDTINKIGSCWGHSHVNMSVYASPTDVTQTDLFLEKARSINKDFFVRLICNKKGEMYTTIFLLDQGIYIDNPSIVTIKPEDEVIDMTEWAKEQIESKVTRVQNFYQGNGGKYWGYGGYGGYGGGYLDALDEELADEEKDIIGYESLFDELDGDHEPPMHGELGNSNGGTRPQSLVQRQYSSSSSSAGTGAGSNGIPTPKPEEIDIENLKVEQIGYLISRNEEEAVQKIFSLMNSGSKIISNFEYGQIAASYLLDIKKITLSIDRHLFREYFMGTDQEMYTQDQLLDEYIGLIEI